MSNSTISPEELDAGWLTTAASQIFLMQLGFACFEVGFVEIVWAKTVIIKNLEATIIGILTFMSLTYSLSFSDQSFFGYNLIGNFEHILLLKVEPSVYELIFISATYATTSATIISGAVLERMKNFAYMIWCFLIISLVYSITSFWTWNSNGWLNKLGYVDCAGSIVVHGTGGMASLIATYALGPRMHSMKNNGKLKPIPNSVRPILVLLGGFLLWYGWFAFNVTSPFVSDIQVHQYMETAGLNALIAPCAAAVSSMLYMNYINAIKFEDIISCILCGSVAITASCFTVKWWSAVIIGFMSSFIYFASIWMIRKKLRIDDPLCVINIHLFGGYFGGFAEGLFASGDVGHKGLFYGGFEHFGTQTMGVCAIFIFQLVIMLVLWYIILELIIMNKCKRKKHKVSAMRVQVLDTYLGTPIWELDINLAFADILKCESNIAKTMLLEFHYNCLQSIESLSVARLRRNVLDDDDDDDAKQEEKDELLREHTDEYKNDDEDSRNIEVVNKYLNHYANALDFLLVVMDNNYESKYDKMQIYNMYIDKNGLRSVRLSNDFIKPTKILCTRNEIHCFQKVYKILYDELKGFTQPFLSNFNEKYMKKISVMPYKVKHDSWSVKWIKTDDDDDDNIKRDEYMLISTSRSDEGHLLSIQADANNSAYIPK